MFFLRFEPSHLYPFEESKVVSNRKIRLILRTDDKSFAEQIPILMRLLNAEELTLDPKYQAPVGTPVGVTPIREIFLLTSAAAGEQDRLNKEIARIENEVQIVESKLENRSFVDRAPAAVVKEHRQRLKISARNWRS